MEKKTDVDATTVPDIEEATFVKKAEAEEIRKEEPDNTVEGTIELSKTRKIHILHELTGTYHKSFKTQV